MYYIYVVVREQMDPLTSDIYITPTYLLPDREIL